MSCGVRPVAVDYVGGGPEYIDRAAVTRSVVVRTDDEVVLCFWVSAQVLTEVIDRPVSGPLEVAGRSQHGHVDLGKVVAISDYALPVSVVSGMLEPAVPVQIWRPVDLVEGAPGGACAVPGVEKFRPSCL